MPAVHADGEEDVPLRQQEARHHVLEGGQLRDQVQEHEGLQEARLQPEVLRQELPPVRAELLKAPQLQEPQMRVKVVDIAYDSFLEHP